MLEGDVNAAFLETYLASTLLFRLTDTTDAFRVDFWRGAMLANDRVLFAV